MDAISFATNTTASEIPSQNSTNDSKDNDPNVTTSSANVDNSIANSSSQDNLASKLDDDMDDEMRLIIFDEKISNSPCSSANEEHENVSKPSETMSCGSSVKNPEGTTQANSTTTTASGHSKSPKKNLQEDQNLFRDRMESLNDLSLKVQPAPETFSWPDYLQETNSEAAPPEYFFQDPTIPENKFEVGHKIELPDPRGNDVQCIATVVSVHSVWICARLDGEDASNDQWMICDDDRIRPVGDAERKGIGLQPPYGFMYSLASYHKFIENQLKPDKDGTPVIAPDECFAPISYRFHPDSNMFKVGQKCEAVDYKNFNGRPCPATVVEVIGDLITIGYDGWNQAYDTKQRFDSRHIFPMGWSEKAGLEVQPPIRIKGKVKQPILHLEVTVADSGSQKNATPKATKSGASGKASSTSRTPSKGGGLVDEKSRVAIVNPLPDELKPAKTKETHTKRISPKNIGQNLGRAFQGASGDMMKSEKAASDSG
ncbi:unnamed protein product, partial [Anisakis simplex]|uniref:SLED domain-containing protein n=1 Tax=Anisakis simplex TaxID=6269 RepID=A0A0M3KBS9_ANISI